MAKRYLRHRAFYIGLAVGVVAGLAALPLLPKLAIEIGAVAFFAVYLALSLLHLPVLTTAHLRAHADEDDAPVAWIFLATFGIVVVAVVSLFQLINAEAAPVSLPRDEHDQGGPSGCGCSFYGTMVDCKEGQAE